jgi:glycosyltransferase involved in cell wall biosynthesis
LCAQRGHGIRDPNLVADAQTSSRKPVTAVVLCFNEQANIRTCLDSVTGWANIIVVDSGSTDNTVAICREYTDQIHVHPYSNHAAQWQWALNNLGFETEWILALDADFMVSTELRAQIEITLPTLASDIDGVYVRHRYVFGGGDIRFGGTKQFWLRLVRRGQASPDLSDLVDFRFNVQGRTAQFDAAVVEYNRYDDDISTWAKKQDKFSLRLAVEEELRRSDMIAWSGRPSFLGNPDERFMWLRDRWQGLPLFVRPAIYFLYRYLLMLGFLDGRAGFLYHFLQGFWLRVVVDWKIMQLRTLALTTDELSSVKARMFTTHDGSVSTVTDHLRNHHSRS